MAILGLGLALTWILLIAYTAQANAPKNIVNLPAQESAAGVVKKTMPQGWSFFTRSPTEAVYVPFKVDEGQAVSLNSGPYSNSGARFGVDRGARMQNVELGDLAAQLPKGSWYKCSGYSPEDCVRENEKSYRVRNSHLAPTLCGEVYLLYREPVPYSWIEFTDAPHRYIGGVRTDVKY